MGREEGGGGSEDQTTYGEVAGFAIARAGGCEGNAEVEAVAGAGERRGSVLGGGASGLARLVAVRAKQQRGWWHAGDAAYDCAGTALTWARARELLARLELAIGHVEERGERPA